MRDRFALWTALAAFLAVGGAFLAGPHLPRAPVPPPPSEAEKPAPLVPQPYHLAPALAAEPLPSAFERLKPLYRVKRQPAPDEWLAHFPELGETFDAYTKSEPTRPTPAAGRSTSSASAR